MKWWGMSPIGAIAGAFALVVLLLAAPYYLIAPDWTRQAVGGDAYAKPR